MPSLTRVLVALAVLLGSLLGSLLLAAPASGAERVVTITAEGVLPKVLQVAAGDTITFVNEDTDFGYRAVATSDNWDLDSGPVGLLPGRSYTHPDPITEAGTYTYRVAEGEAYEGSVLLRGANSVAPPPTRPASSGPSPQPTRATAGPAPSPTGGSGSAQAPPGSFGAPGPPSPVPSAAVPAPAIAGPAAPDEAPDEAAGPSEPDEAGPLAVPGRLGAPQGYRGYGLPAALAVVLAAGVASLLVRLLLAEPAARRRSRARAPVAVLD